MELPLPTESQLKQVKAVLLKISRQHQLAFAAWCCERLYPVYALLAETRGTQEGQVLRDVIDRLWKHVFGKQMSSEEIDTLLSKCDELEFDSDADSPSGEFARLLSKAGYAEVGEQNVAQLQRSGMDAVGAVWSSLEACKDDTVGNVTKVAQCLLERMHGLLWDELSPTSGTIPPDTVAAIHNQIGEHPRMLDACRHMHEHLSYLQETERLSQDDPKLIDRPCADPPNSA